MFRMKIDTKFSTIITSFAKPLFWTIALLTTTINLEIPTTIAQPNKAKVAFFCSRTSDGNLDPVTMMGVSGKKEHQPIVIWKNELGSQVPEQRCQSAFSRFQLAWDRGDFQNLVSGIDRKTGQGLICAVKKRDAKCEPSQILFTVNNEQKAREITQQLYTNMRRGRGNPVYQSSSQASIDMKELIDSMVNLNN
jgi:hypothetical protein